MSSTFPARFPRLPALRAAAVSLLLFAGLTGSVRAALEIEVTSGVRDPVPIAIVPFARAVPADGGLDVAEVIQHDLEGSGRFKALDRERMPATPTRTEEVAAPAWKAVGSNYGVVGRVVAGERGNLAVEFDLINTLTGAKLATQRFTGAPSALRNAAHRVSDAVYQKILGVRGAFATRIAYVSVDGEAPAQRYQLIVADADGANQHLILEARFPLMSPAWSPDGQWLAYVSFETKHSAVYTQLVRTGERRQVSARAGINGAPEWSPDGKKLALTLGGTGGNPDIYILDLASQGLTRITDDPAIDTELTWPCGRAQPVLHLGSGRVPAGLSDRSPGRRASQTHHLRQQLQRPPARVARRHAAGHGDSRQRQLPHRGAGAGEQHRAHPFPRPARRIAEFRAQWGYTHLCRARRQPRRAGHGLHGWPHGSAP
jgi:hypothetical protein